MPLYVNDVVHWSVSVYVVATDRAGCKLLIFLNLINGSDTVPICYQLISYVWIPAYSDQLFSYQQPVWIEFRTSFLIEFQFSHFWNQIRIRTAVQIANMTVHHNHHYQRRVLCMKEYDMQQ